MNMITKIQKIISGVFLCLVFLSFVPTTVTAQNNPTSAYSGWENINKNVSATQNVIHNNEYEISVDLGVANVGKHNLNWDQIQALDKARKEAGAPDFVPTGANTEANYYSNADNAGNVSYYYQKNPEDKNSERLFLGNTEAGKIIIPPGGAVPKTDEPVDNNTNINTEQGLKNALDAEKGRPQNTTFNKFTDIDTKTQNQETYNSNQTRLDEINKELEADDVNPTLTAERRAQLEQEKAALEQSQKETKERIDNANRATAGTKVNMEACESGLISSLNILKPSCFTSILALGANVALKLSAFVLYLAGNVFDYSIEIAVNSAEFFKVLGIVEPMWAVVRDFLNMTFIFVLIYLSWKILLGNGDYTVKDSVARLVLVAILINFSLFAAKIMVDGSNILSLNIYEAIKQQNSADPRGNGSVSARVMSTLGLASVYSFGDAFDGKTIAGCGDVPGTILTVGVFGTILILITTMAFLIAAVLFFIRMLNIFLLFVTSPLWVWGYVIKHPKIQESTGWWWKKMVEVLKFPIIYMTFLYVGLAIFTQLNSSQIASSGGRRSSIIQIICDTATTTGTNDVINQLPVVINFIVVMAILLGAIRYSVTEGGKGSIVGGKLGTNIASKLDGFSNKISRGAAQGLYQKSISAATNATTTAANFAARNTIALAKAPVAGVARVGRRLGRDIGYRVAEATSNKFAEMAVTSKRPKFQTAWAMLSQKTKDPKIFGETKEEASKRRTKGVTARADIVEKVKEEQTKIESFDAWKKTNPNGDKKGYDEYVENKINLIEDAYLGKLKESEGENGIKNSDFIRQAYEVEKDKSGNVIGKKLNQDVLFRNLTSARAFHDKNGTLLTAEKKSRFGFVTDETAKARIKAADESLRKRRIGKEKSIDDQLKEIEKDKMLLNWLPTDLADIDPSKKKSYPTQVKSYIEKLEAIEKDKVRRISGARTPGDMAKILDEINDEINELRNTTEEKIKTEREKIDNRIANKQAKIRAQEKESKKT